MENLKFNWNASFESGKEYKAGESLAISGIFVDASVCANNFSIDEKELPNIVNQMPFATLRVDHSKKARDVIGGLIKGTYDIKNKRIMFDAEIDDPGIQRSVIKGRLKYISIGATADSFCSKCNKPTRPRKLCKCEGTHDIIRNVKLREASIITEPAYASSEFKPIGFTASINSALTESNIVTDTSSFEEVVSEQNIKILGEKKEMPKENENVKAIVEISKTDAIILKKLDKIVTRLDKLETRHTKEDTETAALTKKEKADADAKKLDERFKKLEDVIKKLEKKPPEEEKPKKKQKKPPEEEEEEPKKKKKDPTASEEEGEEVEEEETEEEETPETVTEGAIVEDAEATIEGTTKTAWDELREAAKKFGILD